MVSTASGVCVGGDIGAGVDATTGACVLVGIGVEGFFSHANSAPTGVSCVNHDGS